MTDPLANLAARAAADPFFLAAPLAEFARSEGLDDAGLADALGCPMSDLTHVRLCRAPRPTPDDFRADVAAVATRFGLDPAALAAAVRRGQSLARLRAAHAGAAEPGLLLAARDDDRSPPPPTPDGGTPP